METNKLDYIYNGIIYNLENIKEYMEKDYWDSDDLKFDFWFRLLKHQDIINNVMKLNGLIKSNFNNKDNTDYLKQEIKEKNKHFKPIEINIDWN